MRVGSSGTGYWSGTPTITARRGLPSITSLTDTRSGSGRVCNAALYANNSLSEDRRAKLERLPGWAWDVLADQWSMWIGLMHQFVAEHGHANVPVPYMVGEYNLRSWVATQRGLYKRRALSKERVGELEALPGWVWDIREDNWSRHYRGLKRFAKREGHARAPQRYVEDGLKLGQWVAVQRISREEIPPARKALLEALPGWSWNPTTDGWERGYGTLEAFVEREGHARVPKEHLEGGFRLGQWVTDQRVKRDKLPDGQRERLESLPGWIWDARADWWQQKFALLQQFQKRHGHALVPQGFKEGGVNLGSWVQEQRANRAKMTTERRDASRVRSRMVVGPVLRLLGTRICRVDVIHRAPGACESPPRLPRGWDQPGQLGRRTTGRPFDDDGRTAAAPRSITRLELERGRGIVDAAPRYAARLRQERRTHERPRGLRRGRSQTRTVDQTSSTRAQHPHPRAAESPGSHSRLVLGTQG